MQIKTTMRYFVFINKYVSTFQPIDLPTLLLPVLSRESVTYVMFNKVHFNLCIGSPCFQKALELEQLVAKSLLFPQGQNEREVN